VRTRKSRANLVQPHGPNGRDDTLRNRE
jgi:hypothetical protein